MNMSTSTQGTAKERAQVTNLKSLPEKIVYFFSAEKTEGKASLKPTLGGKGANLAEMTSLGLPVPAGFTISTEVCQAFYENEQKLPEEVKLAVEKAIVDLEKVMGKKFSSAKNPLLVSVRSGARVSMPGMMDTILNLGLNDETVESLAEESGNPRFAWDSYRRFLHMYSNVVMGMNASFLEVTLEDLKHEKSYKNDTDLTVEDLKLLCKKFKKQIQEDSGKSFPMDPKEQLWGAISAVFRSWNTPRAVTYRELHGYPGHWGTAVNVQAMVFGNMGDDSATGVAFTRNPSTGERSYYGEFLINAQGEDVVAGIRTPQPLTKKEAEVSGMKSLEEVMPGPYKELTGIFDKLETYFKDMQDIEFTIEKGKLWMLQTRSGKRTATAALKIAHDMVSEGLIKERDAVLRVDPASLDQLLHPMLDPDAAKTKLTKGLPASPGGAVGQIVFSSEDAVKWVEEGKRVILARVETSPEDIDGMVKAQGILTSRGGMTSHAAVVARGMGKCCVAGCGEVEINYQAKTLKVNDYLLKEGDFLTLDGSSGEVYLGEVKTIEPKIDDNFQFIMDLSDKFRRLKIRTNADNGKDAQVAKDFGAEGIGLCRTEHMFFAPDRIDAMREMILAGSREERKMALEKLLPMQKSDFRELFEVMGELPVTIRLLDPPLHEFLPGTDEEVIALAKRLQSDEHAIKSKIKSLHEFNPMLGHRGCRLAITYPEIYQMQTRAISEAACEVVKSGKKVSVEIMIPLVGFKGELQRLRRLTEVEVQRVQEEMGVQFEHPIGTMIELPRAAITADEIAEHADFFSFGTNDLTQTALGISRDDSGHFLSSYVSDGILESDPFQSVDREGVGYLVKKAVELGRQKRPDIKLGICGEHGGDPKSIEFFNEAGLNYVSCSPYRVPVARLAAARAALLEEEERVQH